MNWHTGNIAEAVAESKAKNAIFVVYTTGQDEMSANLDRFLNDSRVYSKLQTSDFVAVKIQNDSESYLMFSALYKVVPVPSIFFIGKSGTPLDIATGIVASVEELVAKVDKVLLLAGKQSQQSQQNPDASTSAKVTNDLDESRRSIAGAEDENQPSGTNAPTQTVEETQETVNTEQESVPEAEVHEPVVAAHITKVESTAVPEPVMPVASTVSANPVSPVASSAPSAVVPEQMASSLTAAAAERRAAAAATATTSSLNAQIQNLMPMSVPMMPTGTTAQQGPRSPADEADARMGDIQNLVEQRRHEREESQKQRDKENELRRRREGRESQVQQSLTREQELKQLQARLKRERQQEQATRDRILAQIAADRAEQANRRSLTTDIQSNISTTTTATTYSVGSPDYSISSEEETRLQIRLPGGLIRTKAFLAAEPLTTVRTYVHDELLAGTNIHEFTMATSYPRREFKLEEEVMSLSELNLVPNAVLLVLKNEQVNRVVRSGSSLMTIMTSVFWALLTPAAMAFDYLNRMGLQRLRQRISQIMGWSKPAAGEFATEVRGDVANRRNMDMFLLRSMQGPGLPDNPPQTTAGTGPKAPQDGEDAPHLQEMVQQRPAGGFKPPRYGESNIRRLADTKDDEEDKATYNGNSTQQQ